MTDSTLSEKNKAVTATDPAVDAAVKEKLITARIALLLKAPFFGNLATRLQLTNADQWCPTAATDGRYFYYNSEFVNSLSQKEIEFLVGHEVLHVVYDHMSRRGERDPRLFNCAADYCVNADLIGQGIGEKITKVQILHDPKYKGWSAEEVYDDLYENAEKINLEDLINQVLDQHLDADAGSDSDSDSDNNGDGTGKSGPANYTDEERKQLRDEIRDAVLQAAEAAGAGNLPAGVKRMVKDLTEPQMNWREIIQQQIQSLVKSDYTWMRPSRRGWHLDAIFPGNDFADTIDISVAIDTSGSMTEKMLRDILSEIKGIMQSFDDFKINVWTFDTSTHNYQSYTPDNINDIDYYEILGGGGTDFDCNWALMKERELVPKLFLMFTDMMPWNSWGDADYCDTLFIDITNGTQEAPFGQTLRYTAD